jgi:hypothetical protein
VLATIGPPTIGFSASRSALTATSGTEPAVTATAFHGALARVQPRGDEMAAPTGNDRRAMQCNRAAFEASCTPVDDAPATPPTTLADCSVILIAGYGTVKRRGGGGEFGGVEEWLCVRVVQGRPKSNPALILISIAAIQVAEHRASTRRRR